jgi:hypothetical protein
MIHSDDAETVVTVDSKWVQAYYRETIYTY